MAAAFGADVDPKTAGFWADSQVPFGLDANNGTVTEPAWREKPSWYLVATDDKMIPPPAQRQMSNRAGLRRSSRSREVTRSTSRIPARWRR
jgi:hypothetical protein